MVSQWQVSDFVDFGQFAYQWWTSVVQLIFLLTKLVSYYAFVVTPQGLSVTSTLRKKKIKYMRATVNLCLLWWEVIRFRHCTCVQLNLALGFIRQENLQRLVYIM